MKPYHTSFMKVAAVIMLLCSFSFIQEAKASCDAFSLTTKDTTWTFSTKVGSPLTRTLTLENNTDSALVVDAVVNSSSLFTLNHTQFTIPAYDTVSVVITFTPTAVTTGVHATIRFSKHGSDCHQDFGLLGIATGTSNGGGGHDKVVTISPSPEDFPSVAVGKDTCMVMYLVNYTGVQVKVNSMSLLHGNTDFKIDPAFNGTGMDSGGYYRFTVCFTGDANHAEVVDTLVVTYEYNGSIHTVYAALIGHTSNTTTGGGTGGTTDILVADPQKFSFGTVGVDSTVCRTVIVTNKSHHTVVVGGWNQCDSKDFSVSPAFTSYDTLASGASMTFTICYTPTAADSGAKDCNLTMKYYVGDSAGTTGGLTIGFYGIKAGSNTTGGNTVCLRTEQGKNYTDPVVVGGTANHTLYLINASPNAITLNTVNIYGPDAGLFTIPASQFPITVPANSTNTTIYYTFSPTSNSKTEYNAKAAFSLSGDKLACDSASAYLIGYVVHSVNTVDTVVRPIFPTESRTLGLEGNGTTVSTTFYFTNNLNVDCTVNKIWLANGKYFTISSTNPSPTPFVLHPGDNLTVVITYTATDNLVHHDSLMIDANHNLQAQGFELQGVQLAAKVPNALPAGVAINVSPNPASIYLTVDMAGVRSADVQVIDLLGKTLMTAKTSTTWRWNASNAPTGSYIVRISGESTDGEQFVASKRVIVSK